MTEDGSECYYYNHVTGEMRSTHPEDVSDTEIDDNASYGVNGSIDDEEEEEEDYDFKSVDSRPWEERTPDDSTPEKVKGHCSGGGEPYTHIDVMFCDDM